MRSCLARFRYGFLIRRLAPPVALTFALSLGTAAFAAESAGAQHKSTSSASYVIIDPMYATILDGDRPSGLLMVEIGLDVPDAELRESVTKALPVLRDAYVRGLVAYASTAVRSYRQPNVEDIATRLQAITDRTMGKQGAKVLMAQTALRRSR